ncbi:glycoside/pentoside/hexuronide:cation symporter, GPH family [Tenacibaculum sp. MAR_2009_124]|uniref:MFS transporter n=1 Tax=Tenacibaculum sp. MAR_2009_124 TaxID=1250059 RepID=UPI0008963980|nr:MFS transporter [Tenacibaculum sp. MAR_2009_124]SEC77207.1 glycoside/pentoside/hexuronide:cation symporter, GPH family [Tenacibaculum sp. MAR_2009_124]
MSSATTKVPLSEKIAFGVGMFANQMFPAILGIFMVVLVQDLKFSGLMWGMIYLFPRLFDAISDPIMGFVSDNTKSKWGRRKKYVLIGGVLMGVAYIFMWQLFKENSVQYNFWYFFLWSIVFYLGLTFFSVPYVAMGYEMSDDFHERTSIMAIAQWIGQWAWVIAPWFWVIMYDPDWFPSADVAVRELAIWVAIPCAICAIVPAIFIRSKSSLNEDYEPLSFGNIKGSLDKIFGSFVEAFRIKEFRKLCISTFFIYNAFMAVSSLTLFVIVYKLFNGDTEASGIWVSLFGCLGALGTTFFVIPIVAWLSKKMGKKKAFMVSQAISIVGYAMLYFLFIPGKPWMYIIALPFFSFGIGSLFTIMMSMTADVIDIDELNSGKRREGIFGAIYWWMVKVGFAIAGALGGVIIWAVGFEAGVPTTEQPEAIDGLHAFFCFFPVIGTIAAMWVMKDYDVSEERSNEIRAELNRRKKPQGSGYQSDMLSELLSSDLQIDNSMDFDFTSKSDTEIKQLFDTVFNRKLHGLCFSPYAEGQYIGDQLSEEQIQHRMDIVAPYTEWIRSFSCTDGNELIPKVARSRRLKTMVGAWIGKDKKQNDIEINNLINLAREGHVDVAVVGNEVLLREDLSEEELVAYINQVKKAIPDVPVGYVDAYYQFVQRPSLVEVSDVILVNCYPFWEGSSIEDTSSYLKKMYAVTEKVAKGKPVIISETGWPNQGESFEGAQPSEINAMKYFINAINWSQHKNIPMFYFSSFDESWKVHQEGDVGSRWGIWDKNEQLKY